MTRLPIVAVIGSGTEPHTERATLVGRWLAEEGVHLLTGGGRGVMAAVSQAFAETPERKGLVIGVLPSEEGHVRPRKGYPNPWIEIPIMTHLPFSGDRGTDPLSRNHINVLSAAVVIALPGGAGTASEVMLAVSYGRPLVAFLDAPDQIPGLPRGVIVRSDLKDVQAFVRSAIQDSATSSH